MDEWTERFELISELIDKSEQYGVLVEAIHSMLSFLVPDLTAAKLADAVDHAIVDWDL